MSDISHHEQPRMDARLAERLERKKAQLDRYRPLPGDTVRRLNEDLRIFLTYHSNCSALARFDTAGKGCPSCFCEENVPRRTGQQPEQSEDKPSPLL